MKIIVELNYEDEQIAFFASRKGQKEGQTVQEFAEEYLRNLLKNEIVQPFVDAQIEAKYQEAQALKPVYEANAEAGINITVE